MAIATLPIVLSVVLAELAIGGSFVMWLVDRGGRAPSGFLKLVAFVDAGAIASALALVPTFPGGDLAVRAGIDTGPLTAFGQALVVVTILIVIQLVTTFVSVRGLRLAAGLVTFLAGIAALGVIAIARPAQNPFDPFAIAALPLGAVALGGTDGAMLLGHWYLVTPKLSPGPLQAAALLVVFAVVLQSIIVVLTFARGDLVGATGQIGLVVALGIRVGVGLLMTLGVALGAWWTARMNTQSSTGLLYVGLGTALAGEISARVLFFLTGAAV